MRQLLSPRDLAEAIGASESSLKRWADAGRIQVTRTGGGHRRIAFAEAVRFIRASGATVVRPELLGLRELRGSPSPDDDDALYQLLIEGKGREARGLLLGRYLGGDSVATLADGIIRVAMHRMGELWRHDPRGIFLEHRATDCCIQAVTALRAMFDPRDDAAVALGGALPGDPYVLPSLLAATVLAAEGMHVVNLGPETPVASLRHAAAHHRPLLVWLSCSVAVRAELPDEVAGLARSLQKRGASLVIGGRFGGDLAGARGAASVGTMGELAAFARGRMAAP
jgi:methanogenic corrinoid protein MtbC1